jgi:hypothetical protein
MKNIFIQRTKSLALAIATCLFSLIIWLSSAAAGVLEPDQPLGLKGVLDPWGGAFTILWEPVKQRSDGASLTNLAGYNIYRRTTPRGPATKINSSLLPITVFADRVDGKTFYYSIRAVDTEGNESAESFIVDSSPATNVIFLAGDGHTSVVIPGKVSDLLRPSYNKYGVSLTINLKEESSARETGIVRDLRLQLVRGDTKEEVTDVAFSSPDTDVNIGYNVANGQVALGAPQAESFGTPAEAAGASPDQLSLYWFNNVSWIKLGGVHNETDQTINIKSSQLGRYQLRVNSPAKSLTLGKANVFPGLFTPNGDGHNDRVYLVLENPNNASITGEVFDLSGRFVTTLPAPTQIAGGSTSLAWAGQDSSGSIVPSGLYVYRIEGEGKVITGTVSVAR